MVKDPENLAYFRLDYDISAAQNVVGFDIYVYKAKFPTLFHSKENLCFQIMLVLKLFLLILFELFQVVLPLVQNTHPKASKHILL
jgi:uncharacterized membrane protein (DUF373 family)